MTGEIQKIEGAELLTAERKAYPKPSEELGKLLRETSSKKIDDYRLTPVDPKLFEEVKKFLYDKYGAFVTRETVMLNGHLLTPKAKGDQTK